MKQVKNPVRSKGLLIGPILGVTTGAAIWVVFENNMVLALGVAAVICMAGLIPHLLKKRDRV